MGLTMMYFLSRVSLHCYRQHDYSVSVLTYSAGLHSQHACTVSALIPSVHCIWCADRASRVTSSLRAASRLDTTQSTTPARPASSGDRSGEVTPTQQRRRHSQQSESASQVHQRLSTPLTGSQSLQQQVHSSCFSTPTATLPGGTASGAAFSDSYRQRAAVRQSGGCRTPTSTAFSSLSWAELQQQPPAGMLSHCHLSFALIPSRQLFLA